MDADKVLERLQRDPRTRRQIQCVRDVPARDGIYVDLELHPAVRRALGGRGIERLYSHQAEALSEFRDGYDLIISTPTASGKTLTYTLPFLELLEDDPEARALLMFPLKPLAVQYLEIIDRGLWLIWNWP